MKKQNDSVKASASLLPAHLPATNSGGWLHIKARTGAGRNRAGFAAWTEHPFRSEEVCGWLYNPDDPWSRLACYEIRPHCRGCPDTHYFWHSTEINHHLLEMWDRLGGLTQISSTGLFGEECLVPFSFVCDLRGSYKDNIPHQPLRYAGQYFARETGLQHNLYRDYAPHTVRFIQADPIGLENGINFYSYGSDPLSWIDQSGLSGEPAASENNSFDSFRAARPEAMRQAGIPASQQSAGQLKNSSGWEYRYVVPNPGGGTIPATVRQQTMDVSCVDQPHCGAGKTKVDPGGVK